MRAVWMVSMLLLVMVAGCADDKPAEETDDVSFDDVDIDVSDETGAIRGVVVDQTVNVLEGATVAIEGTERSTVSDAEGRFAFGDLEPGTYFLTVSKDLYTPVQRNVDVVAGVAEPEIVKVRLVALYQGDPYAETIESSGFFTCSQANTPPYWYSSSSCHDTYWVDLSDHGVELDQQRTFHADVGNGWQTLLFEMRWEPSASGTSERMGIVVSSEKETRPGCHSFANDSQTSPMYLRINQGEDGPGARGAPDSDCPDVPKQMPAEGWTDMSYFMSVRPAEDATCVLWCYPPGLAVDQSFEVYLTQAYYLPLPDGWSYLDGNADPF